MNTEIAKVGVVRYVWLPVLVCSSIMALVHVCTECALQQSVASHCEKPLKCS